MLGKFANALLAQRGRGVPITRARNIKHILILLNPLSLKSYQIYEPENQQNFLEIILPQVVSNPHLWVPENYFT